MEILDGVEDGAAPHELGEPGKQQVRFMAQIALERPARPLLERLEPPPQLRGLRLGHDADREDAALLPILFDLGRCQTFQHRSSQSWQGTERTGSITFARATTLNSPREGGAAGIAPVRPFADSGRNGSVG